MSENSLHHRSKKRIFSLILSPEDNGSRPKTLRLSFLKLSLMVTIASAIFITVLIYLLRTTPLQRFLPVTEAELDRRYGKEIYSLKNELEVLQKEFVVIQNYNSKLRNALGTEKNSKSKRQTILIENEEAPPITINGAFTTYNPSQANSFAKFDFPISQPVNGFLTNEFRPDELHFGLDFSSKRGSVVSTVKDGKVIFSDYTEKDGNVIMISHSNGFVTVYKHNDVLLKKLNQKVKQGESIALLGNTGTTSSGTHLHFELWQNGVPLNPLEFIISNKNIFAEND